VSQTFHIFEIFCYYIITASITHTEPTAPSAPPQSLSGVSQGSRIILLMWSPPPPIHINGVIENYVVKVTERETGQMWTFFAFDEDIRVGSLHPHYHYDCRVAAFTIAEGTLSCIITVQTEEECKILCITSTNL